MKLELLFALLSIFETLDDDSVTVRDRDSMTQERVFVKDLNQFYQKYFN